MTTRAVNWTAVIAVVSVALLAGGLWARCGWPVAAIVVGSLGLATATLDAAMGMRGIK